MGSLFPLKFIVIILQHMVCIINFWGIYRCEVQIHIFMRADQHVRGFVMLCFKYIQPQFKF